MRANVAALCLSIFAGAAVLAAQGAPQTPAPKVSALAYSTVYCSGFVTDDRVPTDLRVVSGEQSAFAVVWSQGDYLHINAGEDKGVKIGDRFSVMRKSHDPAHTEWFRGQARLAKSMGTHYVDAGQLRVVNVQPKFSVAQVSFSCFSMHRGDIVRPFQERPIPPFKEAGAFDHFAPVSGKPVGTVVTGHSYFQESGQGSTVYVNLGASHGVKVGDYVRFFRYQGTRDEYAPQTAGYQYEIFGLGSAGKRYSPKELPREVLAEGIVLNASRNSATVFITANSSQVYAGDKVEAE
jgi:hypothetical protein